MQSISIRDKKISLRGAIAWMIVGLVFVSLLSWYKSHELKGLSKKNLEQINEHQAQFQNLFQANFYFYFEDEFLPGVQRSIQKMDHLERVQYVDTSARVLFDSEDPRKKIESQPVLSKKKILESFQVTSPSVFVHDFQLKYFVPAGKFGILYVFEAYSLRQRLFIFLVSAVFFVLVSSLLFGWGRRYLKRKNTQVKMTRIWGLRGKFLATTLFINLITGGIIYISLSELQIKQESQRIQKESLLFSQFSTGKVIQDFSSYFYFYYQDKFLPEIKKLISTNENLVGIRVISNRNQTVLFDSELVGDDPVPPQMDQLKSFQIAPELESTLRLRGVVLREVDREQGKLISVVSAYRNEGQDPVFYVEYLFSFESLKRSIEAVRNQIMIDLIPSLILGFLIALVFSQFLISPIKRLVGALKKVSEGEYDVSIDPARRDEIGDLLVAFNHMTSELKKKKELRKYLSDATYRKVMEQPEVGDGTRLAGTRVYATILFCDIRNFVSHCENLDAEEVTSMLNEYFSAMVDVVYKHGGEVDKFIGDAILAVFYAGDSSDSQKKYGRTEGPSQVSTSLQAVYCALEMKETLKHFNESQRARSRSDIEIGIGLTCGEIISGPIGSKDRRDFTVIGDVVNLANRIENLSKKGQFTKVVFSHHVEENVRGVLDYQKISSERIRGKEEDVEVFELIQIRELDQLRKDLESSDPGLRIRGAELLGHSRNPEAIPSMLTLLKTDSVEAVRIAAITALIKLSPLDHAEVVDTLFEQLESETSEKSISALVAAVGKVCTSDRVLDLARFIDSPNERIVANAIETLGQIDHPKAGDLILPQLNSRNNRVKANAAMALFSRGRVEVLDTLKPMLMHSDPLMRSSAAFAIGELTLLAEKDDLLEAWKRKESSMKLFLGELQECVPMLVSLLKDPEPMVKRQSIIALGKIRDKSAVLPIIDNIDFEKDSEEIIRDVSQALRAIGSHKLVREVLDRFT